MSRIGSSPNRRGILVLTSSTMRHRDLPLVCLHEVEVAVGAIIEQIAQATRTALAERRQRQLNRFERLKFRVL
jgi:hypothetical protein